MLARRIVARHPDIARANLFAAASCGDVDEVRRRLAQDPSAATRRGGPRDWTALAYVTYGRLDAVNAVTIATMLLEAGADARFAFDDGWGNAFTLVTGAIGQGEGVKPTHPQAQELVELLLAAGADPYDTQALYNTSIVRDDIKWIALLWERCAARNETHRWSAIDGQSLGGNHKVGTLNYLLGNAVAQNHIARAEWLLEHGADPNTVHAYSGRPVHIEARLHGFASMVALLERHGARADSLSGPLAFQAALMSGDASNARALAASEPSLATSPGALLHVARTGASEAIALLLELGAPIHAADHEGVTALHRAVQSGSLAAVDLLLAAGADVNRREHKWLGSALSWAIVLGKHHLAERLAAISRDVRALASRGDVSRLEVVLRDDPGLANQRLARPEAPTPLFCLPDDDEAAVLVAKVLLAHGADAKVTDAKSRTAVEAATFRGLDEAAALMEGEDEGS